VSIYLDGVPLSSAAHGVVNLADLPVADLERIEVYRGAAPLGFGAATPGGAVNLVSSDDPRSRTLRIALGSFGTGEARGTLGGARGALSWLANAGWQGSRGDFEFLSDNGTPQNPADDAVVKRVNDRYDATSVLARAAWSPRPGVRASLRTEGFHRAQGIPGLGTIQAPNPRLALDRGLVALDGAFAPRECLPGVSLAVHGSRERSRFRDPEGELGLGRQDGRTRFADDGGSIDVTTPAAWAPVAIEAGVAARHERAIVPPPTLGQVLPPESRRTTQGLHASLQLRLANGALVLHGATREDRQRDRLHATIVGGVPLSLAVDRTLDSPQAGARLRLPLALEARGGWSRSARAPEFGELFGDQAVVAANPRLLPERGEGWDAGLAWRLARGSLAASAEWTRWSQRTRDLIAYVPAAGRTVRATNFSRAELDGDEGVVTLAWRALAASGSLAWTRAVQSDRGNIYFGRRLPLRPARQASARLDARHGAWRAGADLLYLGEDWLDPINFRRLAPRTLVGATLSLGWRRLRWTLEGKNLGDRRVQDVAGYPLPGRALFAACEARFGPDPDTTQP
jgi:iron complex outermembrane receptor protein